MVPIHIFYKELPIDENNIFTVNLGDKNEAEEVRLKKSREYATAAFSINQDVNSNLVAVTDTDRQEVRSNLIQKLMKKNKSN